MDKWIRTKSDEEAVNQGYSFDVKQAERVRKFIEHFCYHSSSGEFYGKRFELMEWQWDDIIAPLYGWRSPDNLPRFRTASIWLPKSNGKSSLTGAISQYELLGTGNPGRTVINMASTVAQANIVFNGAANSIELCPAFKKRIDKKTLWIRRNIKTIEDTITKSQLKIFSGESKGKHGFAIDCLIWDELAELTNAELLDTMTYNVRKKKSSTMISISTAGFNLDSVGHSSFKHASNILENKLIDIHTLPVIYSASKDDDWTSLKTAERCNPSWNVSVYANAVQEELNEAKQEPRKESAYRTLRLCQYVGSPTQWLSSYAWQACKETFTEEDFYGERCFVGVDLARTVADAAYTLVFRKDDIYYLLPRYFVPKEYARKKQDNTNQPYVTWGEQGFVNLTEGNYVDYEYIRQAILEDAKRFDIQVLGFDPWQANELWKQLQDDGINVCEVVQSIRNLSPATMLFERLVKENRLRHNNHPTLNFNINCASTRTDSNDNITVQRKNFTGLIDGLVASIIGLSMAMSDTSHVPFFSASE